MLSNDHIEVFDSEDEENTRKHIEIKDFVLENKDKTIETISKDNLIIPDDLKIEKIKLYYYINKRSFFFLNYFNYDDYDINASVYIKSSEDIIKQFQKMKEKQKEKTEKLNNYKNIFSLPN